MWDAAATYVILAPIAPMVAFFKILLSDITILLAPIADGSTILPSVWVTILDGELMVCWALGTSKA